MPGHDPAAVRMLASCYRRCLEVAYEKGLALIAFSCNTTAIFRETLAKSLGPKTPAVPTEVGTAEEEKEERRKESN